MKDLLAKYIAPLFLSAIAILAPIKAIMVVTGILIFVDLITGILAANKRGEKINSAGIRRTISKIFIYQLAIIVGFLIEKYMLSDFLPISKVAAAAIASVEGLSIFENLNTIDGSNLFKKAINLLGSNNDSIKKDVVEAIKEGSEEPPK